MTIEELDAQYEGREEDDRYYNLQAVLGSEKDVEAAYDENGNFHCIGWFDCSYCPVRGRCEALAEDDEPISEEQYIAEMEAHMEWLRKMEEVDDNCKSAG